MDKLNSWKESIRDFYNGLTETERSAFRIKVVEKCSVSESTFYRWRIGKTLPPYFHRKRINSIARTMGYNSVFIPKKTI